MTEADSMEEDSCASLKRGLIYVTASPVFSTWFLNFLQFVCNILIYTYTTVCFSAISLYIIYILYIICYLYVCLLILTLFFIPIRFGLISYVHVILSNNGIFATFSFILLLQHIKLHSFFALSITSLTWISHQ